MGVSPWAASIAPVTIGTVSGRAVVATAAGGAPLLLGLAMLAVPGVGTLIGLALIGASLLSLGGMLAYGIKTARNDVVSAPSYKYRGVAIEGAGLEVLADIQRRFRWAERMFGQVPTGIRWAEVADQVDLLLWEAAGHAAKVSALDVEIGDLGYANDGTPQAALRHRLQEERAVLWSRLQDTQYEADDLAREASNTAAAARIALARSGSVFDLEIVSPSGADLVARGTLAAARARLALLAEVWAELDETTDLTAARLELNEP